MACADNVDAAEEWIRERPELLAIKPDPIRAQPTAVWESESVGPREPLENNALPTSGTAASVASDGEDATQLVLASLADQHVGTHVDLVEAKITHLMNHDYKPWNYAKTVIDAEATQMVLSTAVSQLGKSGRRVISVQPTTGGWGIYLQTEVRRTSTLGVDKSEEFGLGYSYTNAFVIVSEDAE